MPQHHIIGTPRRSVRLRRRLGTLITAAVLAVTVGQFVDAEVALASTGQNPVNCANPYTLRASSFNVDGATMTVELRRSAACAAGWGRISSNNRQAHPLNIHFTSWNPGGPSQELVPGNPYTFEVNGGPGQQICAGFQAWWVDGLGHQHYINWFYAGCASG